MSDPFTKIAPYYDLLMCRVDYPGWIRYFIQIFERFRIMPKKILDLACGTGTPTLLLARQGYEMIGMDISKEMLEVANEKAKSTLPSYNPTIRFIHGDIRDFDLEEKVDVVISLFDSLNYLLDEKDLLLSYASTYKTLREEGYFIFDMNTQFGLSQYGSNGKEVREVDGLLSIWRNSFDRNRKIARLDLTLFVKEERRGREIPPTYQRIDEVHEERGYAPEVIGKLLKEAGFEEIHLFKHLQFTPPIRTTNRVMVVARKGGAMAS